MPTVTLPRHATLERCRMYSHAGAWELGGSWRDIFCVLPNLVTNQSLDARLRESELKNEVKLAETKADLIRWVVGVGVLQTALITVLLIKLSAVI